MTMKISIVNQGNRTGDQLEIWNDGPAEHEPRHKDDMPIAVLKRGDAFEIPGSLLGHVSGGHQLRFVSKYQKDDKWVGNPQLLVVDKPEALETVVEYPKAK